MSFTEIEFAFFLPLVLVGYWLVPRRAAWQNAFLLIASYVFYASWNHRMLALLVGATLVDYVVARYIEAQRPGEDDAATETGRAALRRMRAALSLSLIANLGALAWFKYEGFFAESLNALLGRAGMSGSLPVLHLILPLGISFFTLQKLGYVIDVYLGRFAACRSLLTFATFSAFFPQVTAGPISRAAQLLPQLERARRLDPATLASGAGTFLFGFVLKAYVADYLGQMLVGPVFGAPDQFGVASRWLALFGYTAQIFADFAGYSLLAIGCARLLAIELPVNFNFPFLSRSLPEFWRRWHITLNAWLFDYIYGPLTTGALRGRFDLALMVVFLASGLWHGAAATFLLWGALHGLGMVLHRRWDVFYRGLCRKDRTWVKRRQTRAYRSAAWALTQLWFVLTLIPFRAASFGDAAHFARGLVGAGGAERIGIGGNVLICLTIVVAWHLLELELGRQLRGRAARVPAIARGVVYAAVIAWLLLFVPVGVSSFIYRQF